MSVDTQELIEENAELLAALRWYVDYSDNPAIPVCTYEEYHANARAILARFAA